MKILLFFFLSTFSCLNFSLFAQSSPQNPSELAEVYSNYFSLNREAVFLHINKTKVAPDEDIWFSAYAFSPQFYLPNITTNLHVNLYNSKGILMEAKTVSMEKGQGEGFFELGSDEYSPGEYFIRAGTKYMENFVEEAFFTQSFRILGETSTAIKPRKFDLQLLPEGGHLVANIYNSVGVKIIDNRGKGVTFIEGKVLNSEEEVINTFQSNIFGLSKFRFKPKTGEDYTVIIELENGEVIRKTTPEPEEKGIVLTSTSLGDKILFTVKTNKETYKTIKNKPFLFAFHKDGAMKALNFKFSEVNMSANLTLSKETLHKGVNTITVFTEKIEPVLERLVFNRDSISRKPISANYQKRELDSLVITLSTQEILEPHSISISVLPAETISYTPNNNIFSAFYLQPYIRGEVENGSYYFSEEVELRRRDYDLDLLLLTQGWSRYSWSNIFNYTTKEYYAHEQGFTLTGNITKRNPKTDKTLFIGSPAENLSVVANIDESDSFKVENIFIKDKSELSFSILNEKRSKSDLGIVAAVLPVKDNKNIDPLKYLQVKTEKDRKESGVGAFPENFIVGLDSLDTVFLEHEVLTEEEKNLKLEREINKGEMYGRTEVFTYEEASRYPNLVAFLYEKGFDVRSDTMYSRRELMRKPEISLGLSARPALVFIDGMESDLWELRALSPFSVESVYTNKSGRGSRGYGKGKPSGGGLIEIITKDSFSRNSKKAIRIQMENGFAASKEFYAPKYSSYDSNLFRDYGAVGWFPRVTMENKSIELRVFDIQQPVKLFIEGMTADGALFSEEIFVEMK